MRLSFQTTLLAIVAVFVFAAIIARVLHSSIHKALDAIDIVGPESRAALHRRVQRLIRAITFLAFALAGLVALSLTLERLGINEPRWQPRTILNWLLTGGINVVIILVGALVVIRAAHVLIEHLQQRMTKRHAETDLEWRRRARTVAGILSSLASVVVSFIALLMILQQLTIDVVPILTGAGIAGLAIGFGAQNLVRDVISGFFLILEDQVRIGDQARINGVTGRVEQINLRTIAVRDAEGAVQVFPNGTITALANLSKLFAFAVVDVRVNYTENIDRVFGTLREVGAAMEKDATWAAQVLAPIEVMGIESLDGGFVTVQVRFKTLPLHQGAVANEIRRRVLAAFTGRGIRPYAG